MSDPIKIVHISDLHFGMVGQSGVWKSLAAHLLDLKPHGIIVTGDIADTADPDLLQSAAEKFAPFTHAGIPWVVCAGNHDRHGRGNAGFLGRIAAAINGNPTVTSAFDTAFAGHLASHAALTPWALTSAGGRKWSINVFALETSLKAKYSAQGHVEAVHLQELAALIKRANASSDSCDLLIGLVHHHLLPIAALESSNQYPSGLLAPTTLVNAGTVLEAMAARHVNLVLHGHQHCRNIAKFGIGSHQASDIVVVGAASATGADTRRGCDISRSSYNLLELRDDTSVWVSEVTPVGGAWQLRGEVLPIVSGRRVREGRVMRQASVVARPRGQIDCHFAVGNFRDIEVYESRRHLPISPPALCFEVRRSSGYPMLSEFSLRFDKGADLEHTNRPGGLNLNFAAQRNGRGSYGFQVPVSADQAEIQRLDMAYSWIKSAVLTQTDIAQLPDHAVDHFRSHGKEAVSASVLQPLDTLTLSVEIPPAFAPNTDAWQVFEQEVGSSEPTENHELKQFIAVMPGGFARLTIPFPLPNRRYFLVWKVAPGFNSDEDTLHIRHRARLDGDDWARTIASRVNSLIEHASFTVAIYVPTVDPGQPVVFSRVGLAESAPASESPRHLPHPALSHAITDPLDPMLGAWYGENVWWVPGEEEPGALGFATPGETTVLFLAAYTTSWTDSLEPWGVVRIAFVGEVAISDDLAGQIAGGATLML